MSEINEVLANSFRIQVARIIEGGDTQKAKVFWEAIGTAWARELIEVVPEEQLAQLEALANKANAAEAVVSQQEAEEQLMPTAQAKKPAKVYTEEEARANAARELRKWGYKFSRVAEAMEADLSEIDGGQAEWFCKVLDRAIFDNAFREGSWILKAVCLQRDRLAKRAEADEKKAFRFLLPLLNAIQRLAAERVSESELQEIEADLSKTWAAEDWHAWAKKALERVIDHDGSLAETIGEKLATEVNKAHETFCGATVLIDGLRQMAKAGVEKHRQLNAKERAEKDSARHQRQAERAQFCQAMRGSNPGVEKHGKRKKR